MNMVEVDPKLFITCRLCLDEMGQYQIVPQVQMQIKYCFDIEVEPFDGLPQLICKKCESILSEYAGIKQMFQDKQNGLKLQMKENDNNAASNIQQQQNTVSSTLQVDSDCNNVINKNKKKNTKVLVSNSRTSSVDRESCKENTNVISIKKNVVKRARSLWKDDYIKYFVCRFCTKSLKEKRSITKHMKQCYLKGKYSNVVRKCFVELDRLGSRPNLTFSTENVVCNKDKIINSKNMDYYVLYALKSNEKCVSSYSSDEDFTVVKKKHKRRRLLSGISNETLVIEGSNISKISLNSDEEEKIDHNQTKNQTKETDESDVEYVDIVSSNWKNTSNNAEAIEDKAAKPTVENEKVVQNIITICYNKFLKRLDMGGRNLKNPGNVDAFLQRKILSMGRKVIHDSGLISTGLLRYMEHKDLDVSWIQKNQANVIIKTTLREDKCNDSSNPIWKNLKDIDNNYKPKDFIDIFEKIAKVQNKSLISKKTSNIETQYVNRKNISDEKNTLDISDVNNSNALLYFDNTTELIINVQSKPTNSPNQNNMYERGIESTLYIQSTPETEKQTMLQKLLNENPVANPKQLPKKSSPLELLSLLTDSSANKNTLSNSELSNIDNNNENEELPMPIITSTISLANTSDNSNHKEATQQKSAKPTLVSPKSNFAGPLIKVKPVSELMPKKKLNNSENAALSTNPWPTSFYSEDQNIFVQNGNIPIVYMYNNNNPRSSNAVVTPNSYINCNSVSSKPSNTVSYSVYTNSQRSSNTHVTPSLNACCSNVNSQLPNTLNYSLYNNNSRNSNVVAKPKSNALSEKDQAQKPSSQQYVTMHTVELPNKKTNSPFRYFQELLQIHNIVLLDSIDVVTSPMSCLIKFKLDFHQESSTAVTLCFSLFYNMNTFCIRVRDVESRHLDIAKLSANWQWEILNKFKGDVISKLYENASKISPDVLNKTTYFVNLLSSIVFSK